MPRSYTTQRMARSARLDVRVEPELRERVEARADELGQSLTTFVERALMVALEVTDGQAALDAREAAEHRAPVVPSSREPRRW